jgi:hypothetical protein
MKKLYPIHISQYSLHFTRGRGKEDIQLIRALNEAREILAKRSWAAAVDPVHVDALSAVIGTGVRACEFAVEPRHQVYGFAFPLTGPHDAVYGDADVRGCVVAYESGVDEERH